MNVAVVGTGYGGLVVGACRAETGNSVICADVDAGKIQGLKERRLPIYEPGLEPLVVRNQRDGRLRFSTDVGGAVEASEVIFIAVGTPPDEDGSADLQHVLAVAKTIGEHMNATKVIVTKSTVPVGTAARVRAEIAKHTGTRFHVCSNPEFLKEGAAVEDFMRPDRVIIGTDSEQAVEVMRRLYAPFTRNHERIMVMGTRDAEMTKYAANAMLATRISFMNEIASLCERVGVDVENVRKGIGSDPRIGYSFIYPGCGYGGSCFPKDVKALVAAANAAGYASELLRAVEAVNSRQKHVLFDKIKRHFGAALQGKVVALWGLSFKPNTDDMREAPSIVLASRLIAEGAEVRGWDPVADAATALPALRPCSTPLEAVAGADAAVIVTEWPELAQEDWAGFAAAMRRPLLVDGRNFLDPEAAIRHGFALSAVGRPSISRRQALPHPARLAVGASG